MNSDSSDPGRTLRCCPRCAAEIPADAPGGLCPQCLAGAAFEPGDHVPYFGNYELVSELGRGGMGIVWKARQVKLNRVVALKMIRSGMLANDDEVQRFLVEAEAAAQLQHAGIVSIHEIGEHEGQHYFTMDFVEGSSLAVLLSDQPLPPRRAAELLRLIAEAVYYAHGRGILHRDLKPGNVIIDERGQPRLTDFGLAKRLGTDSELTRTGAALGSPSYMPPEQALGQSDRVTVASDVYSLGAVLYEMLTGRAPFRAATAVDTMRQVVSAEPAAPRQLNPAVPVELETIALKCLEKEPSRRYVSAQQVADECSRFLRGEPILAKPTNAVTRLVKWARRRPAVAALTGAVAALVVTLAVGASIAAVKIANERNVALDAQKAAERERDKAVFYSEQSSDQVAESLFRDAQNSRMSERPGRRSAALASLQKCALVTKRERPAGFKRPDFPSDVDLRSELLAAIQIIDTELKCETRLKTLPWLVSLNESGRIVAAVDVGDLKPGELEAGDADKIVFRGIVFHDTTTGAELMRLDAREYSAPAISSDGKFAAVVVPKAPDVREVIIYEMPSKQPVKKLPWPPGSLSKPKAGVRLIYSTDGTRLATSPHAHDGEVIVWDVAAGAGEVVDKAAGPYSGFALFTRDGKRIIYPSGHKKLKLHETGGAAKEIVLQHTVLGQPAVDHSGALLAVPVLFEEGTRTGQRAIILVDIESGTEKGRIALGHEVVGVVSDRRIAFSEDGRLAFADGPHIKVFDPATEEVTLQADSGSYRNIQALAWDNDAASFTTVLGGGAVHRWEVANKSPTKALRDVNPRANPVATFSADSAWLALGPRDGIALEGRRAGLQSRTLTIPDTTRYDLNALAFRADGGELAAVVSGRVGSGRVVTFDTATGALTWREEEGLGKGTEDVAYTPSGHLLAVRTGDYRFVYDVTAKRELWRSKTKGGLNSRVAFTPDASRVTQYPFPGELPVSEFDLSTGSLLASFATRGIPMFSGDRGVSTRFALFSLRIPMEELRTRNMFGRGLVEESGEFGVALWDRVRGIEISDFPGAGRTAFTGDASVFALGRTDGSVEMRNAPDGALLFRWKVDGQSLSPLAFSPDGTTLVASDGSATGAAKSLKTLDVAAVRTQFQSVGLAW